VCLRLQFALVDPRGRPQNRGNHLLLEGEKAEVFRVVQGPGAVRPQCLGVDTQDGERPVERQSECPGELFGLAQ
jgi:hypothetical protein